MGREGAARQSSCQGFKGRDGFSPSNSLFLPGHLPVAGVNHSWKGILQIKSHPQSAHFFQASPTVSHGHKCLPSPPPQEWKGHSSAPACGRGVSARGWSGALKEGGNLQSKERRTMCGCQSCLDSGETPCFVTVLARWLCGRKQI